MKEVNIRYQFDYNNGEFQDTIFLDYEKYRIFSLDEVIRNTDVDSMVTLKINDYLFKKSQPPIPLTADQIQEQIDADKNMIDSLNNDIANLQSQLAIINNPPPK